MLTLFAIGLGGALGSMARFGCALAVDRWAGDPFPYGTLVVNVAGSFLIGLIAAATGPEARFETSALARQFLMTGVLGGFTTFSAFSLQTLALLRDGDVARALANMVFSVVVCVGAAWAGHWVGMQLGTRAG